MTTDKFKVQKRTGVQQRGVILMIETQENMVTWRVLEFFPFPTQIKAPKLRKKWLEFVRRQNYQSKKSHRLCSKHFVEGKLTKEHPYPELFVYNNNKQQETVRSDRSNRKLELSRAQPYCLKKSTTVCEQVQENIDMDTFYHCSEIPSLEN